MQFVSADFTNFEFFREAALNWELDFRLLSKGGFKAHLSLYTGESIQIGRTSLNGKIEQHGLIPKGYSTIVLPANPNISYTWLNKKVNGDHILIFPYDGVLDSISFDGFDVFVISLEYDYLMRRLEALEYKNAIGLFGKEEKIIRSNPEYIQSVVKDLDWFLRNQAQRPQEKKDILLERLFLEDLLDVIYANLENEDSLLFSPTIKKRDLAVNTAIDIIQYNSENTLNVRELSALTNVSQRTLEYGFMERFRITPKQYITAQRHHMVKKDLISEEYRNLSIFQVAAKYGFWHMGQFAADFKTQFGVLPSVLRKNYFK
ncbi:AraC family transcriptional regulator [Eudoraea chungangensis]|uniref:AraC family transcriptional regulator n=1 Tax=Eudoraea chungangensis TaxID=1481905 RepID=UPI0023EC27D6|nr:AraC family transcriptional regulator [Eudoraea chungangensis]